MSHFTRLKTKMNDKECIIKALKNLHYSYEENTKIRGYGNRTRIGDIVIKTNGNFDVGFIKSSTADHYQIVADWYGATSSIGKNKQKFASEVQREYAVAKIMKEIRKKGYRLKSRQCTETGDVKLLVVKRGYAR